MTRCCLVTNVIRVMDSGLRLQINCSGRLGWRATDVTVAPLMIVAQYHLPVPRYQTQLVDS